MMDFSGRMVLALWNGINPDRRREYDLWHTREHVPERVSVPGVLGARRYVRSGGPLPEYLTLYDVADGAVLTGVPYRQLLENPTDWSRSMRPSFRGFMRICCERVETLGGGAGRALAAMTFGDTEGVALPPLSDLLVRETTAVHLLRRDPAIPDVPFQIGGPAPDAPRQGVILVEGYDDASLRSAVPALAQRLAAAGLPSVVATLSFYELAYALDQDSLGHVVTLTVEDAGYMESET